MRKILTITNVVEILPDGTTRLLTSNVAETEIMDNENSNLNVHKVSDYAVEENTVSDVKTQIPKVNQGKSEYRYKDSFIISEAMKKYNYIALGSKGKLLLDKGIAMVIYADWLKEPLTRLTHKTQRNRIDKMSLITNHYKNDDKVEYIYEDDGVQKRIYFM